MTDTKLLERSHYNAQAAELNPGDTITVAGWVRKRRDLGGLVFVDLYDRTGILQVVFDPIRNPDLLDAASQLNRETVLTVRGTLSLRPAEAVNPGMITGNVELIAEKLTIHAVSKLPPIQMTGGPESNEELRLRYRYLDLRRTEMYRIIKTRHDTAQIVYTFYKDEGFIEVTTPQLLRSTPEGARDFIVPSRLHPGSCYALPQSPQMLKQILMVAGVDRYFQIVKCFRDEDSRADRQPEFTQIDVEMSFTSMETLFAIHERLIRKIFKEILGHDCLLPFRRMTWDTAIDRYGSDKPDLRFELEITDISDQVRGAGISFMDNVLETGGVIRMVRYPGGSKLSRKQIGDLEVIAKKRGAQGLVAVKVNENNLLTGGPLDKLLSLDKQKAIIHAADAVPGDLLCVVAGKRMVVAEALGDVRLEIGKRESLKRHTFEFLWVTEFPLLEFVPDENRFTAMHHPFTAPFQDDIHLLADDPGKCRAQAYDLVLNGVELGGGSVRIHQPEVQSQMFEVLGINPEKAQEQFGFFLEALSYGTPPHCGIAFGLDRLIMILVGTDNLRDVIAFPKTLQAVCQMTQAPSPMTQDQLDIVGLKFKS
ncbi:aspartate--tRNA ligase [bacterium]|nr:aspartate--tRNA ligase [candidate division CSSED10-310 bacterium]